MPDAKSPSPISWQPSQWWEGDDGDWSTFDLRVGTPEQIVRVLPSTAGSATWVVTPGGCEPSDAQCVDARGGLFNQNQSSTWQDLGPFTLTLEQNLGHDESGAFGLDTISLGLTNATGGPTLDSQIIAGIETENWYLGLFGLQQQPMNLTDFSQPQRSVLSALRARNLIPSLSWAYTAGAHYRSKGSFGSLTFGGSDTSKYVPTNVSFNMAPDISRDLVVGLQSIVVNYANGSSEALLPSPTLAFIDSTVPYLYLPKDACKKFESELGLVYDGENNIYFVDDALHQNLANLKPKFTFRLANDKLSGTSVEISLPYESFDLTMKPPLLPNTSSYFPLRRGSDDQITLGRAFLQEAYLITDYDQKNFTVAQATFNDDSPPQIVPIPWNATARPTVDNVTVTPIANHGLSRKATIGLGTGSTIFALLLVGIITYFVLRSRQRRAVAASTDTAKPSSESPGIRPLSNISTQEIGHHSVQELHATSHHIELLDGLAPSGSGFDMNELPSQRESFPYELSAPAENDNSLSSSSSRNPFSTDTRNNENTTARDSAMRISILSVNADPRHLIITKQQSSNSRGIIDQVTKNSIDSSLRCNVNKPLPQVLRAKDRSNSRRYHPITPFSRGLQAPVPHDIARGLYAQEFDSMVADSPMSPTYATVFNIEEYRDSVVVSPILSSTHGIKKPH